MAYVWYNYDYVWIITPWLQLVQYIKSIQNTSTSHLSDLRDCFFRQLRQRTGEQACKLDLGVALYPLFTHYLKSQVVSLLSHLFIIYEAFLDGFFPWGYHSPGHFSASCALQNSFWRLPWSVAHLRCAKACKHHRPSAGIGIGVLIFHITPILGI